MLRSISGVGIAYRDDITVGPILRFRTPPTGKLSGTNGSQFFITTVPPTWLDGKHTILARLQMRLLKKVVDAINEVATDARDNPVEPVMIESIDRLW